MQRQTGHNSQGSRGKQRQQQNPRLSPISPTTPGEGTNSVNMSDILCPESSVQNRSMLCSVLCSVYSIARNIRSIRSQVLLSEREYGACIQREEEHGQEWLTGPSETVGWWWRRICSGPDSQASLGVPEQVSIFNFFLCLGGKWVITLRSCLLREYAPYSAQLCRELSLL